ncbi:MAG: response regulator [Pseudomonadota bacterium]
MGLFSKQKLDEIEARSVPRAALQTVLIVDDEAANRAVMATILRPHYQLLEAADGMEALELVEALDPAVSLACIVSDQRMPNLTGVELFQRVQSIMPLTVRIIVTGYVDVDSIVDSINKAEIYKFIVKPFDAYDFLLTVRRGVESYQMQRQLSEYHQSLAEQVRVSGEALEESRRELVVARGERERAESALKRKQARQRPRRASTRSKKS